MNSLILVFLAFTGYLIAYHSYGKYLSKKIFKINPSTVCPSRELQDNIDYIPTNKFVLFGHHFTSIAGLGPIVGPAIAIIWGWVPAVLWIFFGSIFMGAVHDFGSLVVSLRGKGHSVGDLAGQIINGRVRVLFLSIIFFGLWIVIAIFALIIGILFKMYPQAVLPVWLQIPIAIYLGHLVYRKGKNPSSLGVLAVVVMYATIMMGAYLPLTMPSLFGFDPLIIWIVLLLVYVYFVSTLPVQVLLQPRDYINAYQLLVALALLSFGVIVGQPEIVAPAIDFNPSGAPPMLPFLFVVIACGAISGFHSLVSSGTSSKQCDNESHALFIGYGGMLMEAVLAILVIVAVSAGIGLGLETEEGEVLKGADAFRHHYSSWAAASGLSEKLGAFVTGSSNMISLIGVPAKITIAIMGVFLVSFATTTLDSATRIQRYVISELSDVWNIKAFKGKRNASLLAVFSAFVLAFCNGSGKGALILWPLFGAVNQLLAGLALLVITIYLARKREKIIYTALPMLLMIIMTTWAMVINLQDSYAKEDWLLLFIGSAVFLLELWMVVESFLVVSKVFIRNMAK